MNPIINIQMQDSSMSLKHAAKVFFEDVCGFSLVIVKDFSEVNVGVNIEYSSANYEKVLFLQKVDIEEYKSVVDVDVNGAIFPCRSSSKSFMPFDPIALTWFLMLMPQEQYQQCDFDIHHRPVSESLWLVKNKFHQLPLIDIAAKMFLEAMVAKYPHLDIPAKIPTFTPTFDIDIAFAHQSKSILIHLLSTMSLMLKMDVKTIHKRVKVLLHKEPDPYDVFDEILELLDQHNLKGVFFAMTADRGKYDRNNFYKAANYRKLLKRLSEKHEIGLHPSYHSATHSDLVSYEKKRLENIVDKNVTHVRQHFLRQFLPQYWNAIVECGFEHDYSIGFAKHLGYKVGTCVPFQAFDLNSDKILPLTLHPFVIMDTAMSRYQMLNEEEILNETKIIKTHSHLYNTSVSGVWHNYAMPRNSEKLALFKKQIPILSTYD